MQNKKKLELLAPAGDLEKLKIAVLYGADAVYIGGEAYGLRAKAKNFDIDTLTFYEDIIYQNLADSQRIVFLTEHMYPTLKTDAVFDINENLLFDIDAVAISDEYLNNNSDTLKELKMILIGILERKFGKRIYKEINQMIEDKDPRLDKGIVLDPCELEITSFKL